MGQYICVGIQNRVVIPKSGLDEFQKEFSHEALLHYFEKTHHITDVFERTETEDEYVYQLKDAVVEKELLSFLKDFYSIRYEEESYYQDVLKIAKTCKGINELRNLLVSYEDDEGYFQIIKRNSICFLNTNYFDRRFFNYSFQNVSLSMDGKILMECPLNFTGFVRRSLNKLFQQYKIADSIRVWIDG